VAQKLRKITFPLNWFISTSLPFKSVKEKSGALLLPLIGLILIFEKKSSSPPSAVKEKLTRRIRITERQRRKALPPLLSFISSSQIMFQWIFIPFPRNTFLSDVGGNLIGLVPPLSRIDLIKEKHFHHKESWGP